jgi:hypothetical protein
VGRVNSKKEEAAMISTQLTKGDYDDKLQQLAGEVAIQAIRDLRMLRRRGIISGMKVIPGSEHKMINDAWEYKNTLEVKRLLRDFKNGTVGWWCRAAGINIDNKTLLRRMMEENYAIS